MKTEFRYGQKVREHREARTWTQEHLAAVAGVETRTVQRVEKDQTKNPETLQAIAAAFDVDVQALRSTWRTVESKLLRTQFVSTFADFIRAEEQHSWHAFCRCIMVPLKNEFQNQVEDLFDQIFADRDLIEPDEPELWNCHVECIREPLEKLFGLGFVFYLLDEHRDLFLNPAFGGLKPDRDHFEDWHVRYFVLVPKHGCFQLSDSEPLHRFDPVCRAGSQEFFRTQRPNVGALVYTNALFAARKAGGEQAVNWCAACFPRLANGSRITLDYMQQVTGLSIGQLHDLAHADGGEPFLHGLA